MTFLIQDWFRKLEWIDTFGYLWAQLGRAEEEGQHRKEDKI